ncbi:MAG: hypothetical protein ACK557_14155, partial [Planctomycetota bacterium]
SPAHCGVFEPRSTWLLGAVPFPFSLRCSWHNVLSRSPLFAIQPFGARTQTTFGFQDENFAFADISG